VRRRLVFCALSILCVACGDVPLPSTQGPPPTTVPRVTSPVKVLAPKSHPTTTTSSTTTSTTISPAVVAYWHAVADDYHRWSDWPRWRAVGLCEQGAARGGPYDSNGDGIAWHGSPAGGTAGSGYPGGLGLSVDFWRQFSKAAGVHVSNGAYASPADQIRVARAGAVHGMGGWSSWRNGCVKRKGGY
jgi:hypothetical protein